MKSSRFIEPGELVTVTKMKNVTSIIHLDKKNTKQRIQKINKNEYVDLSTGEIKEFDLNENRGQNLNSIGKTMNNLRELINNNFNGEINEFFGTVTYKKNQRDLKAVRSDLESLIAKIRYKYRNVSKVEYITVLEPQERGAWHAHILFKFIDADSYIQFTKGNLLSMWQDSTGDKQITQVDLQSINNIRNVSSYLITYLANVPYDPDKHIVADDRIVTKEVDGESKDFIRGARLHMYPSGMRIHASSGGIRRPKKETMTFKKSQKYIKKIGHSDMTFSKTYSVSIGDFSNTITRQEYSVSPD